MSTSFTRVLVFSTATLLAGTGIVRADAVSRIGYAYDKQTGELLYSETHHEVMKNGRMMRNRVTYKDPRGNVFAEKHIDFERSLTMPDFELVNEENGHVEAVRGERGELVVRFRPEAGASLRKASVDMPENGIIDAGFDRFIENNWTSLLSGGVLEREFLIPSQLDFYTFEISKAQAQPPGEVVFRLQIKSLFLRLLVSPVLVHYDAESRSLLRYEGVSNIRDDQGRNFEVRIEFPRNGGGDRARTQSAGARPVS